MKKQLIAFDMDSTLIQCEVIDELARINGTFEQVATITNRAMRGQIDFAESLNERVKLVKGVNEKQLNELKDNLPYTTGLSELMTYLKKNEFITAICSGGFDIFANQIRTDFDFDHIRCNQLEIVDGQLSGRLIGPLIDASAKAKALLEFAEINNIDIKDTVAIGDGMNDLAMLKKAGLGIGFCPKPELAKQISNVIHKADLSLVIAVLSNQQN